MESHEVILAKAVQATNEDWKEALNLAEMYYTDLLRTLEPFGNVHVAFKELKDLKEKYAEYKDMLLKDRLEEALVFSETALFGEFQGVGLDDWTSNFLNQQLRNHRKEESDIDG